MRLRRRSSPFRNLECNPSRLISFPQCESVDKELPIPNCLHNDSFCISVKVEDADVRTAIANLLARKKAGDELDRGPKDVVLSRYIDAELAGLEKIQSEEEPAPDPAVLNHFFQSYCLKSPALALACSG